MTKEWVANQADADNDGLGDTYDNCPNDYNPDQNDLDTDGYGDVCDLDDDDDGVDDPYDNCPINYNPDQTDVDFDGAGDACDSYYDSDPVVTLIETDVIDAVDIITSIEKLPGGNGMIAKLQNVVDDVSDAITKYEDGVIARDEYLVKLN